MALIGPKKTPHDFGFKSGDSHLIVNDDTETVKAYDSDGKLLWERPCLARGQYSDYEFKLNRSDTPPGLYRIGEIYRDWETGNSYTRTKMSYGWYSFDMIELERQEAKFGRAGIMLHGGGSACGWPGAWEPYQRLFPTFGCVRMYNQDLKDLVLPLTNKGTVYISVYQEA